MRLDHLSYAAGPEGLAACVQTEAIHSTYRWQGAIECAAELRLMFKTDRAHGPALGGSGEGLAQQRCECRTAEYVFTAREKLTAGLVEVPFVEEVHGGMITC